MNNYRIIKRYPYYFGLTPTTAYVVQKAERGLFAEKWTDIQVYASKKAAEKLLEMLKK